MRLRDLTSTPVGYVDASGGGPEPGANLRELLTRDHERLDRLFEELTAAFNAGARQDAERLWNEFDTGLLAHMAEEEHWLLPAMAACDAPEAAGLLREHEQIRQKLLDLGIGVELHSTRAETVCDFVEVLRGHARREDALAYRWAQRELPEAPRRLLTSRLVAGLRSFRPGRVNAKKAGDGSHDT